MNLEQWAGRWGVDPRAVGELAAVLAEPPVMAEPPSAISEAAAQSHIRASTRAVTWRNNSGVRKDDRGVPIRFGLANDSAKMNRHIKSSDLIGLHPILIQPYHVGRTLGVFVACEVKRGGWRYAATAREEAQLKYLQIVSAAGGVAMFARSQPEFETYLDRFEAGSK